MHLKLFLYIIFLIALHISIQLQGNYLITFCITLTNFSIDSYRLIFKISWFFGRFMSANKARWFVLRASGCFRRQCAFKSQRPLSRSAPGAARNSASLDAAAQFVLRRRTSDVTCPAAKCAATILHVRKHNFSIVLMLFPLLKPSLEGHIRGSFLIYTKAPITIFYFSTILHNKNKRDRITTSCLQ